MQEELEREESEDKYDRLVERAEQLREEKETVESISDPSLSNGGLSNRTFVTGLTKGEVIDVGYEKSHRNGHMELEVRLRSGPVVTVEVEDSGSYEEGNELVRLLEWKGVSMEHMDDLLGETVKLKMSNDYPCKTEHPSRLDWNVYVPNSLDEFGKLYFRADSVLRRLGVQTFEDYISQNNAIDVAFVSSGLFASYLMATFCALCTYLILGGTFSLSSSFLILLLCSLFVMVGNYLREGYHRYKKYRSRDALRD